MAHHIVFLKDSSMHVKRKALLQDCCLNSFIFSPGIHGLSGKQTENILSLSFRPLF